MPFVIVILFSLKAHAIFDFIGTESKKAIELGSYAESLSELAKELGVDTNLDESVSDIKRRSSDLSREIDLASSIHRDTERIRKGPDYSSRRLDDNIRATTDYVARLRKYILKLSSLGTDGAIALNTVETNIALNEIQKNQQTLILQNEDRKLSEIEKEVTEDKSWREFFKSQKETRKKLNYGKLH